MEARALLLLGKHLVPKVGAAHLGIATPHGSLATVSVSHVSLRKNCAAHCDLIHHKPKLVFLFSFSSLPSQTGQIKPVVLPLLWFAEVSCPPQPGSAGPLLLPHHPVLGKLHFA